MIGIYKITNPKGKIYIGSSINLQRREKDYKYLRCKNQTLIYNSLKKYGWGSHKFEIIEECLVEELNEKEIYWTHELKAFSNNGGLVLQIGGNNGSQSDDTKLKKSISMKGKLKGRTNYKISQQWKEGKRESGMKGKTHSLESRNKISSSKKNHKMYSDEWRNKISASLKNRKITWGDNISKSNKGISRNKGKGNKIIHQFDLLGNFIQEYKSITEASIKLDLKFNTISNNLLGYTQKVNNQYKFKYVN